MSTELKPQDSDHCQEAESQDAWIRAPTAERGRPVSLTDGCFSFREPLLSIHPTDDPDR